MARLVATIHAFNTIIIHRSATLTTLPFHWLHFVVNCCGTSRLLRRVGSVLVRTSSALVRVGGARLNGVLGVGAHDGCCMLEGVSREKCAI